MDLQSPVTLATGVAKSALVAGAIFAIQAVIQTPWGARKFLCGDAPRLLLV
jgi:hypothetical protein